MRIKIICNDCKTEYSCEQGAEMKESTRCPKCKSGNVIVPMETVKGVPEYVEVD